MQKKKNNLIFRAPVEGIAGYTNVAQNLLGSLFYSSSVRLGLEKLDWLNNIVAGYHCDNLKAILKIKANELNPAEADLLILSIACEFGQDPRYQTVKGLSMFETNSLPKSWVEGCNQIDQVIVPSAFNYHTFTEAGVQTPVTIVPLGVDTDFFRPLDTIFTSFPETFNFLSISQAIPRKGIDLIIRSFLEVFGNNNDVSLLLRWYINANTLEDQKQLSAYIQRVRQELRIQGGNIFLVGPVVAQQLPVLYNSADAFISPFRGEGWGLPVIEAAACEVPVVTTNWGGVTEYLSDEDALLLKYVLRPVWQKQGDYWMAQAAVEHHLWAEPDFEHLKQSLWEVYRFYNIYKLRAKRLRKKLVRSFQWKHCAQRLLSALNNG